MRKIRNLLFLSIFALILTLLTGCSIGKIIDDDEGEDEMSGESLEYSVEETQRKLDALASENGLEITMRYTEDSTGQEEEKSDHTFGIKGNIYWEYDEDGYGYAYELDEDNGYVYEYYYNNDEWIYENRFEVSGTGLKALERYFDLSGWLYFGHIYDGKFKKAGSVTIAGRDCDLYKYSLNVIFEKVEYSFAIDKETGCTMKYDLGARVGVESAKAGFLITSFKTSGVTAPTLPEREEGDEGDLPYSDPTTDSRYQKEKLVQGTFDLVTTENKMVVAKYSGTIEDLENDSVYIDDFGTLDIYLVWVGFDSEGNRDYIKGYLCLYYYYEDLDSYLAAVDSAKDGYGYRTKNDNWYYFTYSTSDIDGDTYSEMIDSLTGGDYRHPNFEIVY